MFLLLLLAVPSQALITCRPDGSCSITVGTNWSLVPSTLSTMEASYFTLSLEQKPKEGGKLFCLTTGVRPAYKGAGCSTESQDIPDQRQSMSARATFVLQREDYPEGLCLQVTRKTKRTLELGPMREESCIMDPASSWTGDISYTIKEDSFSDYYIACSVTLGIYGVFSVLFWIFWSQTCSLPEVSHVSSTQLRKATERRVADLSTTFMGDLVDRKSQLTWQMLLTTSVLYLIPSLQLTMTASREFTRSGDQDYCFYNFRCLKPLWEFRMFNHLMSNIGYIILGSLFWCMVSIRKKRLQVQIAAKEKEDEEEVEDQEEEGEEARIKLCKKKYGVVDSFDMFYTMALTLAMIGVMSSCYHLCPTNINFQFDTTYMYILATFMAIKLFKNRHLDLTPDALAVFFLLAVSVAIGGISVYTEGRLEMALRVAFVLGYLWACFTLAIVFYSADTKTKNQIGLHKKPWIQDAKWKVFFKWVPVLIKAAKAWKNAGYSVPIKSKSRFIFVWIFLVINMGLSVLIFLESDFPTVLLFIFMANFFSYLIFYCCMKFHTGERKTWPCFTFFCLTVTFALPAVFFFMTQVKDTGLSPAESKAINKDCFFNNFYDHHDLWHFLGSFGLFFMLMFLLTLDDDIAFRPQINIQVF